MRPRSISASFMAALLAPLLACAGAGVDHGGPSPSDRDDAAPALDGGTVLDAGPECDDPPEDRPAGSTCVRAVRGRVVEPDGTPLPNLTISVCGRACYFARTDDTGSFSDAIGHFIVRDQWHLMVHGRPDHVSHYVDLPPPSAEGVVTMTAPIVTPKYESVGGAVPADDSPSGVISAGDVTLRTPDGAQYDVDPEDVADGADGRLLRSVRWVGDAPDFVAGGEVAALYALAPFGMRVCAKRPCPREEDALMKMAVSLRNTSHLPAGTAVEIFVLGTQLYSTPPTAGKLLVVATGHVSADGATIDTDPGEGIGETSFLGVRTKK